MQRHTKRQTQKPINFSVNYLSDMIARRARQMQRRERVSHPAMVIPSYLEYGAAVALAVFLIARFFHRREHLIWYLKSYVTVYVASIAAMWTASQLNRPNIERVLWGVVVMLLVDRFIEGRSRVIRKTDRRSVIEKWERTTGQKFNPRVHELDHVIPFAKGGDNTRYNLRVTTKKENRSKGKRSPRWELIGRWRD